MARLKEIKVEFGLSQSTGPASWIKATAGMTVELENEKDAEQYKEIYFDAWNRVTQEVAAQLNRCLQDEEYKQVE